MSSADTVIIILTGLGLIWAVIAWGITPPSRTSFTVFVKDVAGLPRNDVVLVGMDGDRKLLPDASGMVPVPTSWNGTIVSIRNDKSWAEIMTIRLVRAEGGTTTIIVPR